MDIVVSSRHVEVSPSLRAAAIEKIGRLERYLEDMDRAEVHFSAEHNPRIEEREICEVTISGPGHVVRAKVTAADQFAAIDAAVAKLEHQLHKLKTKLMKSKRTNELNRRAAARSRPLETDALLSSDGIATALLDGDDEDDGDGDGSGRSPRIVKSKRFTIKPMTTDEAVLQMDLLGHDFFFFTNADTELAAVVYKRSDGDVGLIDEA